MANDYALGVLTKLSNDRPDDHTFVYHKLSDVTAKLPPLYSQSLSLSHTHTLAHAVLLPYTAGHKLRWIWYMTNEIYMYLRNTVLCRINLPV